MRQEELEAEEKLAEELAVAGAAAAADLKEQLASRMKDKGDAFDTMIEAEEKIRLGEEGWKARYYQVRGLETTCSLCAEGPFRTGDC